MPNWCNNTLYLSHDDDSMIQKVEDAYRADKLISEFYPCPPELTETIAGQAGDSDSYAQRLLEFKQKLNLEFFGAKDWYEWQVKNWGTKWDIAHDNGGDSDRQQNRIRISFVSAYAPPTGFYDKLLELGFSVSAYYYESGCCFCGQYSEGVDECYDINGGSEWVKENIPEVIDLEFGISEDMSYWEEEEKENA